MKRVLMFFVISFLFLGFIFNVFGSALSEWNFEYRADMANCSFNPNNISVYVENGVAYLSTNLSSFGKEIKEGMRITLNLSSDVSPESISSGIKIVIGTDVMVHKALSTGSYSIQFYTTHSYNSSDKFTIVLYDYGGSMRTAIGEIQMENPRGGVNEGLFLTGVGISVVFVVLSILAVVMYSLKPALNRGKKDEDEKIKKEAKAAKKEVEKMEVDEEIVAAIMAALSMYLGGKKFRIISVKPSHWKYYGRFRSMR